MRMTPRVIVKKLIRRWSISSSARCCDRHALLMISWFTTMSQKNVSDNGSDWCTDTTRRTSCSWKTLSTLSSDHLPILVRLQMKTTSTPGLRLTYVNLKKADWDRYRQEVETTLSKRCLPTDCQRDEKIFRTVLLKAASHHIPTGRHRLHEEPVPAEILEVMTRRDDLRKRDPTSPELPRLNYDIQNRIIAHKRQKWRDFVETLDQKIMSPSCRELLKELTEQNARQRTKLLPSTESRSHRPSSWQPSSTNTSKLGRHTSSGETRRGNPCRWHRHSPRI